MKIRELYLKKILESFTGQKKIVLKRRNQSFFMGENESGKTTIHTFIKGMLFGLERGAGESLGKRHVQHL